MNVLIKLVISGLMISFKSIFGARKNDQKVEMELAEAILEYACSRSDLDTTALIINKITKLECDVVQDVLCAIPRDLNVALNEDNLNKKWVLGDHDQFELQDFRNEWIRVFCWMMKYKSGEASKAEVGNATNWSFHIHKTFSLNILDRINRSSWQNLLADDEIKMMSK